MINVLNKLGLYFHTMRYLKLTQIVWRLKYKAFKYRPIKMDEIGVSQWLSTWDSPKWEMSNWDGEQTFTFLSESKSINNKDDWTDLELGALWVYNLHYLDCLNSKDNLTNESKKNLLFVWIDNNRNVNSIGWDPYCLSLRIVNIIKWYSEQRINEPKIVGSIAKQAHALLSKREFHVQANHLFSNGKALVFAGVFLDGGLANKCLQAGLKILDKEICEQFEKDGGHYELSPMYHQILMWDICDLINLANVSGNSALQQRTQKWSDTLRRADKWRKVMYHTNHELAFFNDCSSGIAPPNSLIEGYLQCLGCSTPPLEEKCWDLNDTGFFVAEIQDHGKLIFDAGKVGPNYQPGHAHADSLSFELSLFKNKLFVNSGTSLYGTGPLRQRQRETVSHNTVEIDAKSSSQVWGGFRVAKRAEVISRNFGCDDTGATFHAAHNGYLKQRIAGIHSRTIKFSNHTNVVQIIDKVDKKASSRGIVRFYLHPDVIIIEQSGSTIKLLLEEHEIKFNVIGGILSIKESIWYPKFGQESKSFVLCVEMDKNVVESTISWNGNE